MDGLERIKEIVRIRLGETGETASSGGNKMENIKGHILWASLIIVLEVVQQHQKR